MVRLRWLALLLPTVACAPSSPPPVLPLGHVHELSEAERAEAYRRADYDRTLPGHVPPDERAAVEASKLEEKRVLRQIFLGATGVAVGAVLDVQLRVLGGPGHKTFLGCLTCSKLDASSVQNPKGPFGDPLSPTSILNRSGPFGSRTSDESACNPSASDPPVVVDEQGKDYGRLTLNVGLGPVEAGRIRWLTGVCTGER